MLASDNRLRGERTYERVKQEGEVIQSENFAVAFLRREDGLPSRFGFVVSKKISKLSTLRNRIERALSEAVRHKLNETKKGLDVVFLAKKSIAKKTTEEIMNEVGVLLKRNFNSK